MVFFQNSGNAQQKVSFPVKVDTVMVVGNEQTKNYIILREIPYNFPAELGQEEFVRIQNRLQNLYLFNRVQLQLAKQGDKTALFIVVTESWYFFPVPIFFINEHDWDKLSYGLQVSHFNFRGRNEKLNVGGWLGYNPSFYIRYFNPWIGKKTRFIVGFSLFHNRVNNKIFDFDEKRSGFSFRFGRRFNLKFSTQIKFSLQRLSLPQVFNVYSLSQNGTDWIPKLSYEIKWDSRDLYEYPRNGIYAKYKVTRTGFKNSQPQFWRFSFDNRFYHPIYKKISFAVRNKLVLNQGELPIYDRVYLGYSERIRGYFNRVLPALNKYRSYNSANISLSSLEVRFPILPIHYFSWEEAPLLVAFYKDLKFGISGGIFVDTGLAWQKSSEISLPNLYTGYGVGLHFHLPYIYVLRLDYAWNDQGEGEFIFDMGISF